MSINEVEIKSKVCYFKLYRLVGSPMNRYVDRSLPGELQAVRSI